MAHSLNIDPQRVRHERTDVHFVPIPSSQPR